MKTLAELLRWHAGYHPDWVALEYGERRTTFAELDCRASQVANALVHAGVQPGERVCVLDQSHDHFFETLFGIAKAGAVYTPLNWRLAPPEMAYLIEDAEARVLLVGSLFTDAIRAVEADLIRSRSIICYADAHDHWQSYVAWRDAAPADDPHREGAQDDTVWQLYTSGTTGQPKGAEITNRNLLAAVANGLLSGITISPAKRGLVCLPLYHIAGAGYAMSLFYGGMTIVVADVFDPDGILRLIAEREITQSFLVPTMINFLLERPACSDTDFRSLEVIFYGASPIPTDQLERAMNRFGCSFIQTYGLTETTGAVCYLSAHDHVPGTERLRSAGRAAFGVDIRVVDTDGAVCPTGQSGEVVIRGDTVMKGYWNQPEATREAIVDGWLHTGDAGYFDADGYLYIHDRVKDIIITGAENVYPAEVESVLADHPAVLDVAVIGVPDDRWGEAVKAVVQLRPGRKATEEELIGHCRARIARYKCPKSVDFADSIPRNPTGKVLKRKLREHYWGDRTRRVN